MDELRAHPFFVSIRWDTLWDDPVPPLETGLVRREPAPADEWDDVGATWDELVGPDGSDDEDEDDGSSEGPHTHAHAHVRLRAPGDDGIEWATDAQAYVSPPAIPPEEIGPHGEMPDYAREAHPLLGAVDGVDAVGASMAAGEDVEDARGEDSDGAGTDGTVSGTYGIHFALPGIDRVSKNIGPGADAVAVAGDAATGEAAGSGVRPGPGHGPGPGPGEDNDEERASPVSGSSTETGDGEGGAAAGEVPPRSSAPQRVPRAVRDSYATSSSDGSPVEKLSAALEAMGIHRGRLRTRSPTPARGTPPSASVEAPDWYAPFSFPRQGQAH